MTTQSLVPNRARILCHEINCWSHRLLSPSAISSMLTIIALVGVIDLGLTAWLTSTIGMFEANYLVHCVLKLTGSTWGLVIFKVTTNGLGLSVLWRHRTRCSVKIATVLLLVVHMWLTVQWVQYLSLSGEMAGCDMIEQLEGEPEWLQLTAGA